MTSESQATNPPAPGRVTSVDFFRGFTMFLLAGEASELYSHLIHSNNSFVHFIGTQFHHHEWHGLHFWDLIQPFFMFIVGVAIPFAVANRPKKGESTELLPIMHSSVQLCFCSLAGHSILWMPGIWYSGSRMSLHNCR